MGRVFVIAVLLISWAGFVHAAGSQNLNWKFYGSVRISTFYTNWNGDMLDGPGRNPFAGTGGNTDAYEQDLNGNTRIGARIKVNDSLTARFECGAKYGDADIRILWGEWDFGAGSLGGGQNYTPLLFPYSNQVYNIYALGYGDTHMSFFGMLYGKREPMIRLKLGTFQIAAVKPRLIVNSYYTYLENAIDAPQSGPGTRVVIPNIQAKYRSDFNWGHINMAAGFQQFEIDKDGDSWDVFSYVLALGGRLNLGKAYFKSSVWGGQNVGNLADIIVNGQVFSTYKNACADPTVKDGAGLGFARWCDGTLSNLGGPQKGIVDNDAIAALIVAGYEIRKGLYVEAGYGYTRTKLDTDGAEKDDCHAMYLQSTIFLAQGVFLTPETGYVDAVQDGQPEIFYAGVKWQINF